MRQQFRPEFINRIDEFIVFQALDRLQIAQIVRLQVLHRGRCARPEPPHVLRRVIAAC